MGRDLDDNESLKNLRDCNQMIGFDEKEKIKYLQGKKEHGMWNQTRVRLVEGENSHH